jgi:hypothetical protein
MMDDLDERNRASSTASSRRGERHQDGDSPQIHPSAALDAEELIRILPDPVRSASGVPQTEPLDGRCDRPSSMSGGPRRTAPAPNVVALNVASQNPVDQISLGQGVVSRNGWGRIGRLRFGDGTLRRQVASGAKVGQFQTPSSAEIRGAAKTEAVRLQAERLADDLAWA